MFSNQSFKIHAFVYLMAFTLVGNGHAMECPTPKRQKVDTEEEKKQPTCQVQSLSRLCIDVLSKCTTDNDKNNNKEHEFDSSIIDAVAQSTRNSTLVRELILKNKLVDSINFGISKATSLSSRFKGNYFCFDVKTKLQCIDTHTLEKTEFPYVLKCNDYLELSPQLTYKIDSYYAKLYLRDMKTKEKINLIDIEGNTLSSTCNLYFSSNEKYIVTSSRIKGVGEKVMRSIYLMNPTTGKAIEEIDQVDYSVDIIIKHIDDSGNVVYLKQDNNRIFCTYYQHDKKIKTNIELDNTKYLMHYTLGYHGLYVPWYNDPLRDISVAIINQHKIFIYIKHSDQGYLVTFSDNNKYSIQTLQAKSEIVHCQPNPYNPDVFAIVVNGTGLERIIDEGVNPKKVITPEYPAGNNPDYTVLPSLVMKNRGLYSVYVVDCSKKLADSILVYKRDPNNKGFFISNYMRWLKEDKNNNLRVFCVAIENGVKKNTVNNMLIAETINTQDLLKYKEIWNNH